MIQAIKGFWEELWRKPEPPTPLPPPHRVVQAAERLPDSDHPGGTYRQPVEIVDEPPKEPQWVEKEVDNTHADATARLLKAAREKYNQTPHLFEYIPPVPGLQFRYRMEGNTLFVDTKYTRGSCGPCGYRSQDLWKPELVEGLALDHLRKHGFLSRFVDHMKKLHEHSIETDGLFGHDFPRVVATARRHGLEVDLTNLKPTRIDKILQ